MFTERMSQGLSLAATPVQPQTLNNSNTSTGNGGVDMQKFRRVLFIVLTGSVTSGGSLSVQLQQSADGATSWTNITGAALTAITASNKVATLEMRADQMTNRYVRALLTETGSQNVVCACVALGGEAVEKPGSAQDVSAVVQRLVL
jgi:hypothetical protein